jgi:hypothetical protein
MRALAATFVLSAILAAEPISLPDSATGVIDGRIAVMFWPTSSTSGGKLGALLPTSDCRVMLAPWTDFAAEHAYDCGVWFQPAEGRYQAWLEKGDERISPTAATINYARAPFEGRGQLIVMPLEAGGRVALAPDVALPPGAEVSLMNFDSCCRVALGVPFTRRVSDLRALYSGVMMPSGHVFAGMFDRRTRDAIAIARPVMVEGGKTVVTAPRAPAAGRSDVFVSLGRPIRKSREVDVVQLTLDNKKPEILFDGDDRIYAAWFDVKSDAARFAVASKTLRLQERILTLLPGRVTTVREELQKLPAVRVSLLAPAEAFGDEPVYVDAMPPSRTRTLQTAAIQPGGDALLEALPAEPVEIVLRSGAWRLRQSVDLSAGIDEQVVFDPHPIVVNGEVFHGRERAANALVEFEADDGFVKSTADREGRYRITLLRGGDAWTIQVTIPGRAGPPFVDGFLQINESRKLDLKVPRTDYSVRVVDAVNGRGIADARVFATNVFLHSPEAGDMTLSQRAVADQHGIAQLQPLREGRIEIQAAADGYAESEKVRGVVDEDDSKAEFEVRLQPIGETVPLQLRMSDGRTAGAAELMAVSAPHGSQPPLWRGQSDAHGVVRVPRNIDGAMLLIRSQDAASAVRTFDADASSDIVLQPPAAPIRVTVPSRTRIAVWIDGIRVSGPAVTFLTWSSEASYAEGSWWAKNLPAQPLRILAWQWTAVQEIATGLRDANAATIPYPWPSNVALNPLD